MKKKKRFFNAHENFSLLCNPKTNYRKKKFKTIMNSNSAHSRRKHSAVIEKKSIFSNKQNADGPMGRFITVFRIVNGRKKNHYKTFLITPMCLKPVGNFSIVVRCDGKKSVSQFSDMYVLNFNSRQYHSFFTTPDFLRDDLQTQKLTDIIIANIAIGKSCVFFRIFVTETEN